jgi:glycine cleavage system H lipoate-binding protein
MTETAGERRFSSDHAWIVNTDRESVLRIGISDFAQAALGEIATYFFPRSVLR